MAKNPPRVKTPDEQTREDDALLQQIDGVYKTVGYSPKSRIEMFLRNGAEYSRELVRALTHILLSQQDTAVLDRVMMHNSIRPTDGWVPVVARISERCIAEQIADELLQTTKIIVIEDLKAEILGKLRELMEKRTARTAAWQTYMQAVTRAQAQAQAAGRTTARIPPPIAKPDGFLPPSDAFPLTRLQPIRGQTVSTDAKWIP